MTKKIFALDFDGVICDSASELAASGWKAAAEIWDDINGDISKEISHEFSQARPVIETGYQAILLVRMLLDGVQLGSILSSFSEISDEYEVNNQLKKSDLIACFGRVRDKWIKSDFASWLDVHDFYPGTVDAINQHADNCYIITTKQKRFAEALVKHAGMQIPNERIHGLESGKKYQVLNDIKYGENETIEINFIEDRLKTLMTVNQLSDKIDLFFASWGYNTSAEKDMAITRAEIHCLTLENFPQFFMAKYP
ncbi:MAG: HAD family hydrolase [Lentisphaeria bacterium]|nr:HAD family hydrolase [Lentisphaeria bacterium]NQZ70689.1 HAD family hydrolase [Lentisphaeria bacterium]